MSIQQGEFVKHTNCPDCGSKDGLALYSNGTGYCWAGCDANGDGYKNKMKMSGEGSDVPEFIENTGTKSGKLIKDITYGNLSARKISKAIAMKYGYGMGKAYFNSVKMPCQVANYYNELGQIIAQKLKNADKDFQFVGKPDKTLLWGKHLWRNKGGRTVIVTEGEMDTLSIAEAYEGKYPVVSLSTGANTAKKTLLANLDWLESFDKIILWFDSDEVGQKALEECKGIFSPKKLYTIPYDSVYKDASDVLIALGTKGVLQRIYEAQEYREDSIIRGSEMDFNKMRTNIRKGRPLPYPILQSKTMGSRDGELWIWTAGSGIGKSTIVTEVGKYQLDNDKDVKLGVLYLEESKEKTFDRFMALDHNVPLKDLRLNHDLIDEEEAYDTYEKYFKSDRINIYDHFGSVETDRLLKKIRYLHFACDCDTIILDHISIAVSGLESDEGERKMLDVFMTQLRSFVEETKCTVHAIVHLKRAKGKNFNEGASISLTDLRGSASLEQLSDVVISAERNQQGQNPYLCKLRVLKSRETGETGVADVIEYNPTTGRYELCDEESSSKSEDTEAKNYY